MDNYQYVDRKMMKWVPFNALLEHSDYLKAMLDGKELREKPVLSEDQYNELNYKLEESYINKYAVTLIIYESGLLKRVKGVISLIDINNHLLFIDGTAVEASKIIEIIV